MPISTAANRQSAVATRRLPWMRRLIPRPNGSIDEGDRYQGAFSYRGITADSPSVAARRRSTICVRRLPWFRRFAVPAPDGTINSFDRWQLAFAYRMVGATDPTPNRSAAEWTLRANLAHYTFAGAPVEWTLPETDED